MRTILKADEGYIYTNGEIYGSVIYLAESVSKDDFRQITKEEYEKIMAEQMEEEII